MLLWSLLSSAAGDVWERRGLTAHGGGGGGLAAVAAAGGCVLITWAGYAWLIKPLLSPLRQIPGLEYGPLLGNVRDVTRLGAGGGGLGELDMDAIQRLSREHGLLFRFHHLLGAERLLVADPDVMKHILVTNSRNYRKPGLPGMKVFRKIIGDGLVLLEGGDHAAHKRLMSPSFNNASIKKMVTVFHECGLRLAEWWVGQLEEAGAAGRKEIDVQNELARTTLDVIGKTAFGYEFNSLEDPNDPVGVAFQGVLEGKNISWRMVLPLYFHLPFPEVGRLKAALAVMHGKVQEIIDYKRQLIAEGAGAERVSGDILGIMMLARDETTGTGLSDTELQHEVMTLMGAGHETTATGMTWFLLLMAQHPEVQQKVREEVQRHLPADAPVTWEALDKLQYLGQAIKETLRMYPPVPISNRKNLTDDVFKDKYKIPAGTVCQLSVATMMRSPKLFEDPDTFRPERFDTSDDENKNMYRFLPFLIGPRMCLGYKFALIEMKVILSCLLRRLTFSLVPGREHFEASYKNRITFRPEPALTLHVSHAPIAAPVDL